LSFDNYDQDQTLVLEASQEDTAQKTAFVGINDQPAWSLEDLFKLQDSTRGLPEAESKRALQAFEKTHAWGKRRIYLGTREDRSSNLILKDPDGRARIVAKVGPDGQPVLQFLDASGKVIEQFPQASSR